MLGSKNMLGKVIKHIIEQEKARTSYKRKRVWIVAKKLHPPLNLKSMVWNQGEKDRV